MSSKPLACEIRIGSSTNLDTYLSVQEVHTPTETVELKLQTSFHGAKDPVARQTKAQVFVTRAELAAIRDDIETFLVQLSMKSLR